MCPDLNQINQTSAVDTSAEENTTFSNQRQPEDLLHTLMVVIEANGQRKTVRALCDTGSQRSYILKSTINEMGWKTNKYETLTHVVFGGASSRKEHKKYTLWIRNMKKNNKFEIQVLDQQAICGYIPSLKNGPWLAELRSKGIHISDVGKDSQRIELLIGADYFGKLYTGQTMQLKCGLVAMETYLGWTVMGKTNHTYSSTGLISTSLFNQNTSVTDLWELETIGISDPCETITSEEYDALATEHFSRTVKIHPDGRYEISLPWVKDVNDMLSNRDIAGRRLKMMTTKLIKDNRLDSYNAVFGEWIKEGLIEESNEGIGHYLPHRGVFKSNSTPNVRLVFDASCKTRDNLSLNDYLMKGPNLLKIIPTLLIKFREKKTGVISDIKKAFLQISVNEDDRKYLKFLWWEDKEAKTVKVFQHARVVFGLNCSPFLLGAVIQHHLNKYESSNVQDVAMKWKKSFYVDNCVTSVDFERELKEFIQCSTDLMAAAKFELRDWKSIEAETSVYKIEWKFNPPSVPWWGGFWEIMVKLVKNILRKILGKACLSYEELSSVLCDCESVSRPLTYLSEDLVDLIPLSPSMFLQEISTVGVPDLDQLDTIYLKKRYRYQQMLREQLRKRFRHEYLATLLQPRKKNNYCDLKIGEIVLIEDDLKKRLHWPMAKVIAVYPGKDKRIPLSRLKTAHTEFLRPVQRIYPLEIRSTPNEGSTPNESATSNKDDKHNNFPSTLRNIVTTRNGRTVKIPSRYLDT
ncbi:uncharacterized protein [Parasteatoda tepidariorum]|uniref:uncharacterized protein n=1 Tax=Parasteatoda tepidariorum TaxID=114398 RepID=UPI0039BD8ED2